MYTSSSHPGQQVLLHCYHLSLDSMNMCNRNIYVAQWGEDIVHVVITNHTKLVLLKYFAIVKSFLKLGWKICVVWSDVFGGELVKKSTEAFQGWQSVNWANFGHFRPVVGFLTLYICKLYPNSLPLPIKHVHLSYI